MISRALYVTCDVCGDPAEVVVGNADEARRAARGGGFTKVGHRDICVRCREDAGAGDARMASDVASYRPGAAPSEGSKQ